MKRFSVWVVLSLATLPSHAAELSIDQINGAVFKPSRADSRPLVAKAQILLDRQRYSPGVIDGLHGDATEIALKAFQSDNGLEPTGTLDEATFSKLTESDPAPVLKSYAITGEDIDGPFIKKVPNGIEAQARLDRLAYTGPRELLAEQFHMDEDFLKALNPKADFDKEGTEIVVAAVEPTEEGRAAADAGTDEPQADRLVIDKSDRTLRVLDETGNLMALYPATIGSKNNPAPSGELKVVRVAKGPTWTYDPEIELEGKGDRPDRKMTVKAGPNNPVGTVWIELDKDHYGIHGSPEPEKIGKTFSSGCVRLTNWDAEELASLVAKDTPVVFQE